MGLIENEVKFGRESMVDSHEELAYTLQRALPSYLDGSLPNIMFDGTVIPVTGQIEQLYDDYLLKEQCVTKINPNGVSVDIFIPWTDTTKGNFNVLPRAATLFLVKYYIGDIRLNQTNNDKVPYAQISYKHFKKVSRREFDKLTR